MKSYVLRNEAPIEVLPDAHERQQHADGHVDDVLAWVTFKVASAEIVLFAPPKELRDIAKRLVETAEKAEEEPTPCDASVCYHCRK
jgi:hypothetical protein